MASGSIGAKQNSVTRLLSYHILTKFSPSFVDIILFLFIYLFIYLSIYLFIYLIIYLFIHSFILKATSKLPIFSSRYLDSMRNNTLGFTRLDL